MTPLGMTPLAIYDMDRTITRTGTFTPFLIHAALRLAPWRLLLVPVVLLAMLGYGTRLLTRGRMKEINQHLLLGPHIHAADLARVTANYAARVMALNVRPGALDQIAQDRAAGRRLVLATASYRLYVEAIGAAIGFDDVIATNSVIGVDARVTAKIDGENCYGPAKLRMIEAWLEKAGIARGQAEIRFYSDHISDAPVMEWADVAIAANPSGALRRLAAKRGWRVVEW